MKYVYLEKFSDEIENLFKITLQIGLQRNFELKSYIDIQILFVALPYIR